MKKQSILKQKRFHPSKRASLTMLKGAKNPGGSRVFCSLKI